MREISLYIIYLLLISAVSGEEDFTCEAGYGIGIFTSGLASQCSGISKITTEAECKLAAEYNRKNNIDNNVGFGGRVSYSSWPPGCFYRSGGDKKYWWNDRTKSTRQCSNRAKCICKTKTCTKCPINLYSEGGINPTCTPCPKDRPTTNFKTGQSTCIPVPTITCEPGHEFTIGDGITKKKECTKCKANTYSSGGPDAKCKQCPTDKPTTNFKTGQTSINACIPVPTIKCEPGHEFTIGDGITKPKECTECKANTYSSGGADAKCKQCPTTAKYTFLDRKRDSIDSCTSVENAITCSKAGEGDSRHYPDMRLSGTCDNIITTKEECAEAAKINKKFDSNNGFGSAFSSYTAPPGCFLDNGGKYYLNINFKAEPKCGHWSGHVNLKCICKRKKCIQCPKNTYNEKTESINPTCTPCPSSKPTTNFKTGQTTCIPIPTRKKCDPGLGVDGDGIETKITKCVMCPDGYFSDGSENRQCKRCTKHYLQYETNNLGSGCRDDCAPGYGMKKINDKTSCYPCAAGYSSKGGHKRCEKCPIGHDSTPKSSECVVSEYAGNSNQQATENQKKIQILIDQLNQHKEKQNDLSIKNSRLWQRAQIRLQHDKYMQQREKQDNEDEKDHCKSESNKGTVIFPAIEISNEIEKIEDTTCIDTNRDELLKSFCSFTSDLDNLFQIQSIDKEAKTFWPNICCKERNDKTLEACDPPKGSTIKREDIIPFALSQGGDYSRHNLYVEVTDTIKKNGYLHKGMLELLDSLNSIPKNKKLHAKRLVNLFFNDVSLCGPRILDTPGGKDKKKLCELFIPYQHSMMQFNNLIENLYMQPMKIQSSFLETMERSLRKRSAAASKRLGKNNIQNIMQMKPMPKAGEAKCTGGAQFGTSELKQNKDVFCSGYNHLDLSDRNIKNVAVHYLKSDIAYNDNKEMFLLSKQLRYEVTATSCPSPLFTAEDISIQRVAMDANAITKEWVAVINLNTKDENGYLQSELPYCEDRKYLISTKVKVKAYVDEKSCCKNIKDYKDCADLCEGKLKKLKDMRHKHYSKDVVLTGTQYTVQSSYVGRRRRLLKHHNTGC